MESSNTKKSSKSKKSVIRYFDGAIYTKISKMYDLATKLSGWRKFLSAHALDGLQEGKMLDVGCGTGVVLVAALQKNFDIIGLDASEGMLEKAAVKGVNKERLICGSACALPFADESFDVVVASGSLVHVPDINAAASEISRVLVKGGQLRIIDHATPVQRGISTPIFSIFSQLSGDIIHDYIHYFNGKLDLKSRKTLGRGGYLQQFDFIK